MATPKRDNPLAARALVDAALFSEATACDKHKITLRTLQRYRAALDTDLELSQMYAQLSREMTARNWADELDAALSAGIRKIKTLIEQTTDPASLGAVTEAVKSLATIAITKEVLGAENDAGNSGHPATGREDQAPAYLSN